MNGAGKSENADRAKILICSPLTLGAFSANRGTKEFSILKVDIEGAEAVVFSKNYESWIDRMDNIVIEIHNASSFGNCAEVFGKAIAGRGFSMTQCEELTVCKRLA